MASAAAFDVVHDRLVAEWTATPLVFENDDYQAPDAPEPFVYVEVFGDFFDQASIGARTQADNLWREGGQVYLHVMTEKGVGSRAARVLAKQLADLFRGQEISGVRFRNASIGAGDPARFPAGSYFAMTATIEFERDE